MWFRRSVFKAIELIFKCVCHHVANLTPRPWSVQYFSYQSLCVVRRPGSGPHLHGLRMGLASETNPPGCFPELPLSIIAIVSASDPKFFFGLPARKPGLSFPVLLRTSHDDACTQAQVVGRQRGRTAAGSSKGPLPQGLSSCKAHAMPLWNCLGAGVGRIFKIDFPSL